MAEVVCNKFTSDQNINDINMSTDHMETKEGGTRNLSNIAINMPKNYTFTIHLLFNNTNPVIPITTTTGNSGTEPDASTGATN